jgi:hypothetical protein
MQDKKGRETVSNTPSLRQTQILGRVVLHQVECDATQDYDPTIIYHAARHYIQGFTRLLLGQSE